MVVEMRPEPCPSKHSSRLTLHPLESISLPYDLGFLEVGTCKIKGWLYNNTICGSNVTMLLDSGASFSCISEPYLKQFPGDVIISQPRKNTSAVDASNRPVTIIGEVEFNVIFKTTNGILEIHKMVFIVLQVLSVPVIIGCEVLGFLDFEVRTHFAVLRGQRIPRIFNNTDEMNPVQAIQYDVKDAVVVDTGDGNYCTIIRAQPREKETAPLPEGDFELNLMTDASIDVAPSRRTFVRRTSISAPHTRILGGGELKAKSQLFTFEGFIENIPVSLHAAVRKFPGINDQTIKEGIASLEPASLRLSSEQVDKMTANSALSLKKLKKMLRQHEKFFALSENELGSFRQTVALE